MGAIYLDDSIDIRVQINLQVIAIIVEDLNLLMCEEKYEILKNEREELLN